MKRLLLAVTSLLMLGSAFVCAGCTQEGATTAPQVPAVKATDCLKCSFSEAERGTIVIAWEFRNPASEEVWIPVKFNVTEKQKPDDDLPVMFLVPGARMMSVAALFSMLPHRLGMEEGCAMAELARVAPGGSIGGTSEVIVPFTWKDPPNSGRPNPFTPWGAGNYKVHLAESKVERITGFQMAIQVYRLPETLVASYRDRYPTTSDHLIIVNDHPPLDMIEGCEISGKYWASALTRVENRMSEIGDFAEWVVSPIYKVDWPVGEHPPVGLKNEMIWR